MTKRILKPNTTQTPDLILDNLSAFTNPELRIILVVLWATYGCGKERTWLTDAEITTRSGMSRGSISPAISSLVESGFLQSLSGTEFKIGIVVNIDGSKLHGSGEPICPWCDRRTVVLHRHHWPIPRRDGGKETVEICPTCHATAHARLIISLFDCITQGEFDDCLFSRVRGAAGHVFPGLKLGDQIPFDNILVVPPEWMMPLPKVTS